MGGNALLVSSGEDGQQQCVYVTTEGGEGGEGDESTILTLDTAYADAVAQLSGTDQVTLLSAAFSMKCVSILMSETSYRYLIFLGSIKSKIIKSIVCNC